MLGTCQHVTMPPGNGRACVRPTHDTPHVSFTYSCSLLVPKGPEKGAECCCCCEVMYRTGIWVFTVSVSIGSFPSSLSHTV
jgi:hypothetical protein